MNKSTLIAVLKQFNSIDEKIKTIQKLTEKDMMSNFCNSEVHCVDIIGKIEYANVTKIAEKMNMTRGAISKITRKLMEKNVIVSYQLDCNKKEIYFRLTDKGSELYKVHEQWHVDWEKRSTLFFDKYTNEELDIVNEFLGNYQLYLNYKIDKLRNKDNKGAV
ncbi:MarR family transcriptional regulator [Sedimentibacter sp. zth1]|uniref:MarR family transcriptional regulator n=1 Tax=Sedimentibacter sp. zth1 TaxID=2816908 RepID=UPI001A912B27|nr:MarR family transcriptional regulator [Sedimentibacter sp. zth1]QSX07073.1 MarR family transcriptional regulator [Sedimentibacter sp. zth1]